MIHEIRYFLEDHWLKLLIGIIVVTILYFIFSGSDEESGESEEVVNSGLVTDGNYETKSEDASLESEYLEESGEKSEDSGTNDDVYSSGEDEEDEDEETEEGNLVVSRIKEDYSDEAYKKVISKYDSDGLKESGDVTVDKNTYNKYGSEIEGCNRNYYDCVDYLVSELKWSEGDIDDELEKTYNTLGDALVRQNVAYEGMKGDVEDSVSSIMEVELWLRAEIIEELGSMVESENKEESESRVKGVISDLKKVEDELKKTWENR